MTTTDKKSLTKLRGKCDSIKVSHQRRGMKIGLGQMQGSPTKPLPAKDADWELSKQIVSLSKQISSLSKQISSLRHRRILPCFHKMQRRAFFLSALAFKSPSISAGKMSWWVFHPPTPQILEHKIAK